MINKGFIDDEEKIEDLLEMSKEDFSKSYSYLTEEEYYCTLDEIRHILGFGIGRVKKMNEVFKCPNCNKTMYLDEENSVIDKEVYDKYICKDCDSIIVLDLKEDE
jgi:predicted RNA-binding Zn-ribbon protein involved in translation (DUF1610 family)